MGETEISKATKSRGKKLCAHGGEEKSIDSGCIVLGLQDILVSFQQPHIFISTSSRGFLYLASSIVMTSVSLEEAHRLFPDGRVLLPLDVCTHCCLPAAPFPCLPLLN